MQLKDMVYLWCFLHLYLCKFIHELKGKQIYDILLAFGHIFFYNVLNRMIHFYYKSSSDRSNTIK